MANTINDSDVVGGSRQITIGSQVFDTDDFSIDEELTKYVRRSSNNIVTGRKSILGESTFTATFQYPSSSVNAPAFGDVFTTSFRGVTLNCVIDKVGERRVKDGEAKIPVSGFVKVGTVVTSTAT